MNPAVGSLYSLLTFTALAALFVLLTHALFAWDYVPSDNRLQASLMAFWYLAAAYYAMLVGKHRDVTYLEALRRGGIDLKNAIRKQVMR